jgi:hypothetical protein
MNLFIRLQNINITSLIFSGVFVSGGFVPALASEPGAAVKCTTLPRTSWVDEPQIRKVFGDNKYRQVFVKISRGNCYEFYAIGKDNTVTEAYYDPVSGELMQSTHIGTDGKATTFDRTTSTPSPAKSKLSTKLN